jgi:hypothetical protein
MATYAAFDLVRIFAMNDYVLSWTEVGGDPGSVFLRVPESVARTLADALMSSDQFVDVSLVSREVVNRGVLP